MGIPTHALCAAIRDEIIGGLLPPGSRLAEGRLAHRFGVSRVPVREALRALESEGFVVSRRHAGCYVAEPTPREAADLLQVRALLEPLGSARAAERRTEAHLRVLRGLVRLGRQRVDSGETGDLPALESWLLETLAQASGSASLAALLTQLRWKTAWMFPARPGAEDGDEGALLWQDYGVLVDAVARGEADRAREVTARRVERCVRLHAEVPLPPLAESVTKHAVNVRRDGP